MPCRAVIAEYFCNIPISTCSKHAQILRLFQIPDLPAQLPVFLHKAKDARHPGQVDRLFDHQMLGKDQLIDIAQAVPPRAARCALRDYERKPVILPQGLRMYTHQLCSLAYGKYRLVDIKTLIFGAYNVERP